jgi:DNA invertase Pin-like site-specific DNA recombinase|tara:strand:+ start:260 stop:955 length:696 start_codon:yes stop_codon:yes gene_type:complete
MKKAVSYYRTSSLKNVGADKDSKKRQEACCDGFAKQNKYQVVNTFYDAGVSGKTNALDRPEFKRMIFWCEDNNVSTIIVEDVKRYARDVVLQETTYRTLAGMGFEIYSASGDVKFEDDIHSTLMRQIVGAMSEYDRKSIAFRLQVARERRATQNETIGYLTLSGSGKCSGRKSYEETDTELVREAKRLARINPLTKRKRSIRTIGKILFDLGYKSSAATQLSSSVIQRMVA